MQDYFFAGGFGGMGDFDADGQPAHPFNVRLEDIDQIVFERILERHLRVPVFACG